MVLLSFLGVWKSNNKVEFVKEETIRGVPIMYPGRVRNLLLQARVSAAQATRCVPIEVLVLLRSRRPFTWYSPFLFPHLNFSRK